MFNDTSIQLTPLWQPWLLGLMAAVLCAGLGGATALLLRKRVKLPWVLLLGGLRLGVIVLFLLLVLQPVLSTTELVTPTPELLVLLDTSRSMVGGDGTTDRFRAAIDIGRQGQLGKALRERYRLNWYAFADTARPVDEAELDHVQPEGASTRLADSLAAAYDHARALGKRPERILLVSDGNDRGSTDPAAVAKRLGIVVDVLPAADVPAADAPALTIADVQCAPRVLLGSETHFRVTVQSRPPLAIDQEIGLTLLEDGKTVGEASRTLKAGQREQTIALAHRPEAAGIKQYEVRLRPAAKGSASEVGRVSVQVVDSKSEVLVLEDTWRWEYKFLHRLFEDDPSFRFTAFLARGRERFVQFGSPDRRVNLIGFPQGRADLAGFDLIFLGDVAPARWPRGLATALARMVADEGRSLVVIAGPNVARLADSPELHALLPVELTRESDRPVGGPIDLRMRPDASDSPFFFQLADDKLPPVDQIYPAQRKRPGATVLLEAAGHRNAYGNLIAAAEQTVGRGRVLFVATDTLWKWQTLAPPGDGPAPYSTFWRQAFRALAPNRARPGPVNLWLTADRTRCEAGRPLVVHAEIESDRELTQPALEAAATIPDGRRLPLVFARDPAAPRRYRAELMPPQPGQLQITAQLRTDAELMAEAATAVQVTAARSEEPGEAVDHAALARLASTTGGQIVDPSRPETWPAPGETPRPAVAQTTTIDLSANFTLLLALCGLLGVDWVIRLYKGLV